MTIQRTLVLAVAMLGAALAGCAAVDDDGPTESVAIQDFEFSPAQITVAAGTTVTWTNTGEEAHAVTADEGAFSSDLLAEGESFSYTFDTPGTYAYHCGPHPFMTASVTVT